MLTSVFWFIFRTGQLQAFCMKGTYLHVCLHRSEAISLRKSHIFSYCGHSRCESSHTGHFPANVTNSPTE